MYNPDTKIYNYPVYLAITHFTGLTTEAFTANTYNCFCNFFNQIVTRSKFFHNRKILKDICLPGFSSGKA